MTNTVKRKQSRKNAAVILMLILILTTVFSAGMAASAEEAGETQLESVPAEGESNLPEKEQGAEGNNNLSEEEQGAESKNNLPEEEQASEGENELLSEAEASTVSDKADSSEVGSGNTQDEGSEDEKIEGLAGTFPEENGEGQAGVSTEESGNMEADSSMDGDGERAGSSQEQPLGNTEKDNNEQDNDGLKEEIPEKTKQETEKSDLADGTAQEAEKSDSADGTVQEAEKSDLADGTAHETEKNEFGDVTAREADKGDKTEGKSEETGEAGERTETLEPDQPLKAEGRMLLGASGETILAEKVPGSEIAAGDQIVIVFGDAGKAISQKLSGKRVASSDVTIKETESRKVITAMGETAAVFTVEDAGDGSIYLKSEDKYLSSPDNDAGLYYADEPTNGSLCRIVNDIYLYYPNVVRSYNGNSYRNYYLEYYNPYHYFSSYGKTNSNASAFQLEFYRIGNKNPEEELPQDTSYYLPVFQTSDTHGYLADTSGKECLYLLAYISDQVKDVRGYGANARKDLAVLLDGGDIFQGNTMSNLLDGNPLSAAYQIMGYDAITIGNHDFDWGIENTVDPDCTLMDYSVQGVSGANTVPVLNTNLYQYGEKVTFAHDYIILEKTAVDENGSEIPVRVGVIGLAGEYGSSIMEKRFAAVGFSVDPGFDRVNALAAELEESGACDATILLVHEEADLIASSIGENTCIDLVLGGHTHQFINGLTSWQLRYLEPGCNGKGYGYCELVFQVQDGMAVFEKVANAKTVQITEDSSKLTNSEDNASRLDPEIVTLTDQVMEELEEVLSEEIGYITESCLRYTYLEESGSRSTTCGNWYASIYGRIAEADVAFVNNGGLRTDLVVNPETGQRWITHSDLYQVFPFGNIVYTFEITYGELLEALQYSLTERGGTLFSQMAGVDCYYTDQTVNAIVKADGEAIYANGKWKSGWKDKTLRVAMNEFIATTDRESAEGLHNPFKDWMDTERFLGGDVPDNEGAYEVLCAEAAAGDGLLKVDTMPHYILGEYPNLPEETEPEETTPEQTEPEETTPEQTEPEETSPEQTEPEKTEYTITYQLNGGTWQGSAEDIQEVHEEGSVITVHEAPVREGYVFLYWEGSRYQPGDLYTVMEGHTFVAQWEETAASVPDETTAAQPSAAAPNQGQAAPATRPGGSPPMGDASHGELWLALAFLSLLAVAVLARRAGIFQGRGES